MGCVGDGVSGYVISSPSRAALVTTLPFQWVIKKKTSCICYIVMYYNKISQVLSNQFWQLFFKKLITLSFQISYCSLCLNWILPVATFSLQFLILGFLPLGFFLFLRFNEFNYVTSFSRKQILDLFVISYLVCFKTTAF